MNAPRNRNFPPTSVARNIGEVAHDVITLAELQLNLLKLDFFEWINRSKLPLVMLVTCAIIALGAVPIALATLAFLINDLAALPLSACFAIATGVGLLIAGVLAAIGYRQLMRAPNVFDRSQRELNDNVEWVKQSFRQADDAQ